MGVDIAARGHAGDVLDLTAGSTMLPWFALIVGYALVIPNTWWRWHHRVVFGIALFPSAVILGVGYWEGNIGQLMDAFQEMLIWLGIALAIAIYTGSHKITQLTCQANAARRFGHYKVLKRLLECGRMGEVYLAEHAPTETPMCHQANPVRERLAMPRRRRGSHARCERSPSSSIRMSSRSPTTAARTTVSSTT